MSRTVRILGVAALLCLPMQPVAGQAPAGDLARCESLYALYQRHNDWGGEGRTQAGLEARAAQDQCRRGNTAAGIAVLERKLRAMGFKV